MYLPISPPLLIVSFVALIATLLYLREYFLRKKTAQEQQKITQDTRQKSFQLLHAAELAETEVIAGAKYQLDSLLLTSEKSITASQEQLIAFMADLQKRSAEFEEASRKTGEARIGQLFDRLEERLSDFLVSTEQKTTSSIELELKATLQLIDTYKEQQIKLIDENVIAMMEQTLN